MKGLLTPDSPLDVVAVEARQVVPAIPRDQQPLLIRDLAMLELMYSSGLRLSELTHLQCPDVDLGYASGRLRTVTAAMFTLTCCAILSPVTCWNPAAICALCRSYSGMPIYPPRKSIPILIFNTSLTCTTAPIHAPKNARGAINGMAPITPLRVTQNYINCPLVRLYFDLDGIFCS